MSRSRALTGRAGARLGLGALALGCGLGALAAIAMTAAELQWGPLRAAGVPPAWGIAALSLPVTLLGYRPAKGAWFALLHRYGFMPRATE